ncbi:MAG: TRAP transporter substrate-binding protein [Opitutaceae bacterium]|nr:TRAP transporter substrate-binding protein [Opitutaceae bacterium]
MRLAHVYQLDSPSGMGFQAFAEKVEEYSQGRIEMKVFPAGHLGSNRNIYISSKTGAIDFCVPTFPMLADIVPEMTILNAGYLFDDFEDIKRLLVDPNLGQKWNEEIVEKSHVRILGAYYYGKRVVTTGKKSFTNPEGVKGLKIRAVPNPMSLSVIKGLGGNPTPMAMKEIFIGLSQGVIDAQENPYPTIWANKWYEVQKYAIETNHQLNAIPFAISERSWKKLSPEDRIAIERASSETMDIISGLTREFEADIAERLKAKGMIIVPHDELDIEAFKSSVRESVKAQFEGKVWPVGLMDQVLSARES